MKTEKKSAQLSLYKNENTNKEDNMRDNPKVSELMSTLPVTVDLETPIKAIAEIMASQRVSAVIIVEDNKPQGVVTERDMVRYLDGLFNSSRQLGQTVRAEEVMSSPPVCIEEDACMFDALVLKQTQRIRHLPVIDDSGEVCGLLTSADLANALNEITVRHTQIIEATVLAETEELRRSNDALRTLSLEDAMLKIGNRRSMEVDLAYTHSSAMRYQRPYSIALFDVDHFKIFNDTYGHQAGDEALIQVASHLRNLIRSSDRLYRYGGEEILMLLPETPIDGAQLLAQRCVDSLAALGLENKGSPSGIITMSCGVASPDGHARHDPEGWKLVVEEADQGLYQAKRSGRNQIAMAA